MPLIASIILGIVLGITEFLPVSSLGHSIILAALFGFPPTKEARDTLAVFIQAGAVLAVIVYYSRDLLNQARQIPSNPKVQRLWLNVIIAFIPIGILGLVFNNLIKKYLFSPLIVAAALIVGGVIFLFVEQRKHQPATHNLEDITVRQALLIGIAQIIALVPGVSRSGATIIGGMLTGLDRTVATTFTFYLFIPTLGAASAYSLYTAFRDKLVDSSLIPYFLVAAVVGFVVSLIAIRWLLRYISTHDFRPFGVYRIIVGVVVIIIVLIFKVQ